MRQALQDVKDSVDLSLASLHDSHKHARNSKQYKQAELRTRALLRRLNSLADQVSIDDRKAVEDARQRVQDVHDELLTDIMSKRK
jgi:hypothetical protein